MKEDISTNSNAINELNIGMTIDFALPELGEGIEEADVLKILVTPGESISLDHPLIEIETEKATIEVPAPQDGSINKILVAVGDTIKVGQVIVTIDTTTVDNQSIPSQKEASEVNELTMKEDITDSNIVINNNVQVTENSSLSTNTEINSQNRIVFASPSIRKLAREIGVNIQLVQGSGLGGKISEDDVKLFSRNIDKSIQPSSVTPLQLPDFGKWGDYKEDSMSRIRKTTASNIAQSWGQSPHVTLFQKANITAIDAFRKELKNHKDLEGAKLTMMPILIRGVSLALKEYQNFNVSIDMKNNKIITKNFINVGVAVDTERGLLVPVIKNTIDKTIVDIAHELMDVSEKSRDKKLALDDMRGGNFTISNLGSLNTSFFTPIINPPEVGILGVGRALLEPVWNGNDSFVPELMMPLSLSFDHRIIDGADGAAFLNWIVQFLQNPESLILK